MLKYEANKCRGVIKLVQMDHVTIVDRLKAAAHPGVSVQRQTEILQEFVDAVYTASDRPGQRTDLLLGAVFMDTVDHATAILPDMYPLFAVLTGWEGSVVKEYLLQAQKAEWEKDGRAVNHVQCLFSDAAKQRFPDIRDCMRAIFNAACSDVQNLRWYSPAFMVMCARDPGKIISHVNWVLVTHAM